MTSLAFRRKLQVNESIVESVEYKTLVIGDLARWSAQGRSTSAFDTFHFTAFDLLTKDLLAQIDPNIVLSPLLADDFDVMDVAINLSELGFTGLYRAITNDMPNADMIRVEVHNQAPALDFDLLVMPSATTDK